VLGKYFQTVAGASCATRFSGIAGADGLNALPGKASRLRPDEWMIGVEPASDGWRRGIGRKSCQDDPISRKIRFVSRREGNPADLKEQRDGRIGGHPALMHVARRLT
jgi:hypothetical protein